MADPSRHRDPVRLVDDPSVPSAARDDLVAAAGAVVPFDAGAGLDALRDAIARAGPSAGAEATTGAGATSGGAALSGGVPWLFVGAVGVLALAVGAWLALGAGATGEADTAPSQDAVAVASPGGAPVEARPLLAEAAVIEPEAVVAPAAAEPATSEPEAAEPEADLPARRPAHASGTPAPVVDSPEARRNREIQELAEARRLLATDPAAALRLVEAGQREFRGGMFAQEREAIAVLSLDRLGRAAAARARGARFLARFPDSAFAERIRRVAGDAP